MGSASDLPVMQAAIDTLESFGIEVETVILLGASVLTIWLLCQKPFIKFVDRITHLPLPQLKLHKNRT